MPRTTLNRFTGGILLIIATQGCSDRLTTNTPNDASRGVQAPPQEIEFQDVPAVKVDLPPVARAWDTSDVALEETVRRANGYVTIAFKEPASARLRETGVREPVSAATQRLGYELVLPEATELRHVYESMGAITVRLRDPTVAVTLRTHPLVDYVEPPQGRRLDASAGAAVVRLAAQQGSEILTWGAQMVQADHAWEQAANGSGAKILMIDTGYERGHEDLPDVWSQHCGGEFGGCVDSLPVPHGTHVFGTFTARSNGLGIIGIANGVTDASGAHVWAACSVNRDPDCDPLEVVEGIDTGIFWGVQVINMSFSGRGFEAFRQDEAEAVSRAQAADILLVAAGGNNCNEADCITYPANCTGVLGVSGVKNNWDFADTSPCPEDFFTGERPFSNAGQHIDLSAPFWALSTVVPNTYEGSAENPPYWCGTSHSAPHVSGVAAIVRARYPDLTWQHVHDVLTGSAFDRGPSGWDQQYGWGIVDAVAALTTADTVGTGGGEECPLPPPGCEVEAPPYDPELEVLHDRLVSVADTTR